MMNKVILVGHGKLAKEMKNSAEMIFGTIPNMYPIEFLNQEGLDELKKKLYHVLDEESDYLILSDLFCGTPYNASCAIAMENKGRQIEILSGMSLPLVLEIATMLPDNDLETVVQRMLGLSVQTVQAFSQQVIVEEEEL